MLHDHLSSQFSRISGPNISRRYAWKENDTRLSNRTMIDVYQKSENMARY
jgi:hypothetical protein